MTAKAAHTRAGSKQPVKCPECTSQRVYHDGIRHTNNGDVQRYLCKDCGYRFSNPSSTRKREWNLNSRPTIVSNRQVCDLLTEESKNLAIAEPTEAAQREGTIQTGDVKGKIVDYSFRLMKQGLAKTTIDGRTRLLKRLVKLGGNLLDPESIKQVIAQQEWSAGRKDNAVDAYTRFLQFQNMKWDPPRYRKIRTIPFIPAEAEIDMLIGASSKRIATFLQLLKETGIRCGEACNLKWTDIGIEDRSIRITPEKGSNPRIFQIPMRLMNMINALPTDSTRLFPPNTTAIRKAFQIQRKRAAHKLKNPRLLQIKFHTLRHWKATMEYHKTKDILHVMRLLGHRSIQNTLRYTQLIEFKDEEYTAKVAASEKEVCVLVEAGFEFVCDYNGSKIFRKRK